MAHKIEIMNGKVKMAWAGEKPWHTLGTDVTGKQLTPMQMCEVSGNDWEVEVIPGFIEVNQIDLKTGKTKKVKVTIDSAGLVRKLDGKILDTVTPDWKPVQNAQAMEFFNEFVAAGDMEMEVVGSLKGGRIVFGLAKVKESFELFKGDRVDSYLLFSNFHQYGFSTDVRFTAVRVVCWNTIQAALNAEAQKMVKYSHRREFNPESVKELLGISKVRLDEYKQMATFLGSKKAKDEDIVSYFKRVLPGTEGKLKEMSKNAEIAYDLLHKQPGHEFAEGSWWQPYNAVTFLMDHVICRTQDQRLKQSWYGTHKGIKEKALELALDFAKGA